MVLVGIQLEKLGVSGSAVLLKACTAQCSFYLLVVGPPAKGVDLCFIVGSRGIGERSTVLKDMDILLTGILVFLVVSAGCFWNMMLKRMMIRMTSPEKKEDKEVYVLMGSYPDSVYMTPMGENIT